MTTLGRLVRVPLRTVRAWLVRTALCRAVQVLGGEARGASKAAPPRADKKPAEINGPQSRQSEQGFGPAHFFVGQASPAVTGSCRLPENALAGLLKLLFVIPGRRTRNSSRRIFRMFMDSGQTPTKWARADLAGAHSISRKPEIDGFRNDAGEFSAAGGYPTGINENHKIGEQ